MNSCFFFQFLICYLNIFIFSAVQQFDQVIPAQSENDVRVVVIDDTYHSSVDGNDETCNIADRGVQPNYCWW